MNAEKIIELKEQFFGLKTEIQSCLDSFDTKSKSHLQNYLYFYNYPLFSFAESVIILCENGKYNSAKVLLRSLFEAHIDIAYHQLGDSEYKLAASTKSMFDTKIAGVKELDNLIKKHPNLESENPSDLFSKEYLKSAIEWAQSYKQAVIQSNNLGDKKELNNLLAKAIKCDENLSGNIEKGHYERMYQLIYRQLSPVSHLNIEGTQEFVNQNNKGEYIFSEGEGGDHLLLEAIDICLSFTKDLYDTKVIDGERNIRIAKMDNLILELK